MRWRWVGDRVGVGTDLSHDRCAVDRRQSPAATLVSVAAAEARGCDRLRGSRQAGAIQSPA
ncbi:hypothetical protein D3C77_16130 [compost metagenome]